MTSWGRALVGAVFGSAVTLAIHPVSRAYIVGAFQRKSVRSVEAAAGLTHVTLPQPTNPKAVSIWMQTAAEELQQGHSLKSGEIRTLLGISGTASKRQPNNAYWPQFRAVLLAKANRLDEARAEWIAGSLCQRWDDMQTSRLLDARGRLASIGGWDQAWTYGYAYFSRSSAEAKQVLSLAQRLVSEAKVDDASGLAIRYATICNGSLLRDGSHSIAVGERGTSMVELATYPPSLSEESKPKQKRIWIAQTKLLALLRQNGEIEEARRADKAFRANEAWLALTERQDPDDNLRDLCLAAVAIATLPGTLAACSMAGLLIYMAGHFAQPKLAELRFFSPLAVGATALIAGIAVQLMTHSWVPTLSVALTMCFLIAGPSAPRRRRTDDLGPLYVFTIGSIWLLAFASFSMYLLSTSTEARALLPLLGAEGEYLLDEKAFLALGALSVSLLCLVAPAWALVRRFGTPDLVALTLRRFGAISAIGGLVLAVFAGPLAVYADRACAHHLSQILENEPVYYLVQ